MSHTNSWKLAALFSVLVMICLISPAITHAILLGTPPLQVTFPNGSEIVNPKSNPATIAYTLNGANSAVATATFSFTTNGGATWKAIATVPITAPTQSVNTYTYDWTVPAQTALKTACKVMVVIKNNSGGIIAKDVSNANFTILPFLAIS